ncbi:hypothetical protein V6N13_009172 [Hibiscus sabdariffa]
MALNRSHSPPSTTAAHHWFCKSAPPTRLSRPVLRFPWFGSSRTRPERLEIPHGRRAPPSSIYVCHHRIVAGSRYIDVLVGSHLLTVAIRQKMLWSPATTKTDSGNELETLFKVISMSLKGLLERKEYVNEEPVPIEPAANAPRADKDKFKKHMDDMLDVGCLMLATMTPELQKQHENLVAYEMIQNLKEIYEGQARNMKKSGSKSILMVRKWQNQRVLHKRRNPAKGDLDLRVGNGARVAALAVGTYVLSVPNKQPASVIPIQANHTPIAEPTRAPMAANFQQFYAMSKPSRRVHEPPKSSLEELVKRLEQSLEKFQDRTKFNSQEIDKQISRLEQAVGYLESRGKLPSQTETNPRENVSAITLRSGTVIEKQSQEKHDTKKSTSAIEVSDANSQEEGEATTQK